MTDAAPDEVFDLLRRLFGAGDHLWSIGTLAGFMGFGLTGRVCEEGGALLLIADQGRARLRQGARLLAFETLSSAPRGWNHGIALGLPGLAQKGVPQADTGMGWLSGDPGAVLRADRARPVLELMPGHGALRWLFRPAPGAETQARRFSGQAWSESRAGLADMPGDWIVETPFLRGERSMAGGDDACPIHSVPVAQARGLSHAATTPVPEGWTPLAHVFPPHPARVRPGLARAFDPGLHAAFQQILARHGRPDLRALKAGVRAQLNEGRFEPPPETDRHGLTVIRVTLRQWLAETGSAPPADWLNRFDRPLAAALRAG